MQPKGATVVCCAGTAIFEDKPFSPQREAHSLGRHFQLQWGGQGGGARVAAHHRQRIHPANREHTALHYHCSSTPWSMHPPCES